LGRARCRTGPWIRPVFGREYRDGAGRFIRWLGVLPRHVSDKRITNARPSPGEPRRISSATSTIHSHPRPAVRLSGAPTYGRPPIGARIALAAYIWSPRLRRRPGSCRPDRSSPARAGRRPDSGAVRLRGGRRSIQRFGAGRDVRAPRPGWHDTVYQPGRLHHPVAQGEPAGPAHHFSSTPSRHARLGAATHPLLLAGAIGWRRAFLTAAFVGLASRAVSRLSTRRAPRTA